MKTRERILGAARVFATAWEKQRQAANAQRAACEGGDEARRESADAALASACSLRDEALSELIDAALAVTIQRGSPLSVRVEHYTDRSAGPDACWLWKGVTEADGYGRIYTDSGRRMPAHRAAYELVHGTVAAGLFVCHRCDVRNCVNPAHLFLGTPKDNTQDMIAKGRSGVWTHPESRPRGEAVFTAKLTPDQVREIRELAANGLSQREIAKRYGVGHAAVRQIVIRNRWAHVA